MVHYTVYFTFLSVEGCSIKKVCNESQLLHKTKEMKNLYLILLPLDLQSILNQVFYLVACKAISLKLNNCQSNPPSFFNKQF